MTLSKGPLWVAATTLATLALLTACGEDAAAPAATPVPAPTTAPSAGTQPAFPSTLSDTTADSGRTLTTDEVLAEVAVSGGPRPTGFRGVHVVVDSGLGSFSLAAPPSYSVLWRAGDPPDALTAEAQRHDPAWATDNQSRLRRTDAAGPLRAIVLDTGRPDEVAALVIIFGPAASTGAALAEEMRAEFARAGHTVDGAGPVHVNGADGAYAEFTSAPPAGGAERRVRVQVRIPDPPNNALWGLTCDAPESRRAEARELCAEIGGTFRPLPRVAG